MESSGRIATILLIIYPVLFMIPESLKSFEVAWLGHGPLLIGISILIPLLIINVEQPTLRVYRTLLILGGILTIYLILKLVVITPVLILEDELWRIRGWISFTDILTYGVYLMLISIIAKLRVTIPVSIYLVVTAVLYVFDLLNPFYVGPFYSLILLVGYTSIIIGNLTLPAKYKLISCDGLISVIADYRGRHSSVVIGWPCTGLIGLFLYATFYIIARGKVEKRDIIPFILGLIITFMLNSFRISFILYLNLMYDVEIGELFHSLIYEIMLVVVILGYVYGVSRLLKRKTKKSGVTLV